MVELFTNIARAVDRRCQRGNIYRKDLPVIAVAALFEEHCRFGLDFQSGVYENMLNMTRPCRNFLIKRVLNAVEDDFHRWSQAISASYDDIPPGDLRVYLSQSPKIDIFAVFHIIFQSLRIRHVCSIHLISLTILAGNHDNRHDGSIEFTSHFHDFLFRRRYGYISLYNI